MLLWHGSRTANFLGILKEGLRVNPSGAILTGARFGNGVYFADAFAKSEYYTEGNKKIVLLCEVAIGKKYEIKDNKKLEKFQKLKPGQGNFDTVFVKGRQYPDPSKSVVIPNGMIMPIGDKIIEQDNRTCPSNYNEYIVKDHT